MGLSNIVRAAFAGAILVSGCAMPKAVCSYGDHTQRCSQEYKNASLQYYRSDKGDLSKELMGQYVSTQEGNSICTTKLSHKKAKTAVSLMDQDCDGKVDVIFSVDSKGSISLYPREQNEIAFERDYDSFVRYIRKNRDGISICAVSVDFRNGDSMLLIDDGCDGKADSFTSLLANGELFSVIRNGKDKEFQENYDDAFHDGMFDEMKKMEGKK